MKFQSLGNKPTFIDDFVRNDEASAALTVGKPVCFSFDGAEDGLGVVYPSTVNDAQLIHLYFAGIVTDLSVPVGNVGNARRYGVCLQTVITRATRSATSGGASWSSVTSLAKGQFLGFDTVNNNLLTIASTLAVPATDSSALSLTLPYLFLAETVASIAASATATTDSRTVLTVAAKVFVRVL